MRELSLDEIEAVTGAGIWDTAGKAGLTWVINQGLSAAWDNRAAIGNALMTPTSNPLPSGAYVMM